MTLPETTTSEKRLRLRKRLKEKKPSFARQESWKYVRLKENWRRPRGLDNKVRKRIKGWPPRPCAGYRGPKDTRTIHPSGLREVLVYTTEDILEVDPKTQAARIAHNVGRRSRVKILTEARKRKIRVLNIAQTKETREKKAEASEEAETEEPETEEAMKTEKPRLEDKMSKSRKKVEKK
jgi:large subunit ribosomal protein L32e